MSGYTCVRKYFALPYVYPHIIAQKESIMSTDFARGRRPSGPGTGTERTGPSSEAPVPPGQI
jgi:hypothetical protein